MPCFLTPFQFPCLLMPALQPHHFPYPGSKSYLTLFSSCYPSGLLVSRWWLFMIGDFLVSTLSFPSPQPQPKSKPLDINNISWGLHASSLWNSTVYYYQYLGQTSREWWGQIGEQVLWLRKQSLLPSSTGTLTQSGQIFQFLKKKKFRIYW